MAVVLYYRASVTVLGWHENDDYLPEDGILVVRDSGPGARGDEWSGNDAHPCGTIVRTGQGWLRASGGDGPCVVRLRTQAGPPDEELEAWDDLVEVPYRSQTGAVSLAYLTTGSGAEDVRLDEPGLYRVRVAHRRLPQTKRVEAADDEDERLEPTDLWQLDFSPTDNAELPRWLRRGRQAVRMADPSWSWVLNMQVIEIANLVQWAGQQVGMTVDDLRQWGIDHHRGDGWLDQPLRMTRARRGYPTVAEIAAAVGVPEPTSRRGLLPLFAALGVLTYDGTRYLGVDRPPRVQDVLELPADAIESLESYQATRRFSAFAADLVSVASWSSAEHSVESLAARTLASEDEVRQALRYAENRGLLRIEGELTDRFILAPVGSERSG